MDPLNPATGYVLRGLLVPATLACLLCFKWRFIADYFLFAENLLQSVAVLNLNYTNYAEDYVALLSRIVGLYFVYTIANRSDIFINSVNGAFRMFMVLSVVYNRPLTIREIALYIVTALALLFVSTLMNVMLIFCSEIYLRLQVADKASVNLLNGMHEGVIILSHASNDQPHYFLYCNKSAQKMISQSVGPIEDCDRDN